MSVINKMLLDLDERKGRPGGEATSEDAVRSVKLERKGGLRQKVLVAVLSFVLVGLATAWWLQPHKVSAEEGRVVVQAPPPVALAKSAEAAASISPVASPAAMASAASIASVTSTASMIEQARPVPVPPVPLEESARTMQRVPSTAAPQPTPARPQTERAASVVETPPAEVAAVKASPRGAQMSSPPTSDAVEAAPTQRMSSGNGKSVNGKTYSPEQLSNNLLGEAIGLDQRGHQEEAKPLLQRALVANPLNVRARQLLAQLQIDTGRAEQARDLLVEGLRLMPDQPAFTLTLAQLQAEKGDVAGAIRALESKTAGARDDPQANALLGALLLQIERYDDAVQHYLVALRSDPANTNWLVGTGIALEGAGKRGDAAEAYRRAQSDPKLTAETADFLNERLTQLKQAR